MTRLRSASRLAHIAALVCLSLAAAPQPQETKMSDTTAPQPAESIGQADMDADGTIILHLRAVSPTAVGDALIRYPKDHAQYKMILDHLGGLEPGQSKPVRPFD
jgi:hypothetical protein